MAIELVANSSTPGTVAALAALAAPATAGAGTITTTAPAPVGLQGTGQFRVVIDREILIVTAGANTTTWTVTRGAEGSTAASHLITASIFHYLTAGALQALTSGLFQGTVSTSLGSAVTVDYGSQPRRINPIGTLSANCTVTFSASGRVAGASSRLFVYQPAAVASTLSSGLSTGGAITSLPVAALPAAIPSGATVTVTSGANTQAWTLSVGATLGATTLTVSSQTPNFAYAGGSIVVGFLAYTLTLSDGVTPVSVPVASTPGDLTVIDVDCSDTTNMTAAVVGGSGLVNPMIASGDVIYGGSNGTPTRLAKGADGQVLTLAAGVPSWGAGGGAGSVDGGTPGSTYVVSLDGGTP